MKVLSVYVASSLAGLGQVDLVTARLGAPDWIFWTAVILAGVGLVVVVLLAAALRRGVTLKRFIWVCVTGVITAVAAINLLDALVDRLISVEFFVVATHLIFLGGLPVGLAMALLWPLGASRSEAPDGDPA